MTLHKLSTNYSQNHELILRGEILSNNISKIANRLDLDGSTMDRNGWPSFTLNTLMFTGEGVLRSGQVCNFGSLLIATCVSRQAQWGLWIYVEMFLFNTGIFDEDKEKNVENDIIP